MPSPSTLKIKGLAKRQVVEVTKRADRLGMTLERYVKHLVENDLAISREAKTKTFDEILGPSEKIDEVELDRLIDSVKARYRRKCCRVRTACL
jgi:hypothetical protein